MRTSPETCMGLKPTSPLSWGTLTRNWVRETMMSCEWGNLELDAGITGASFMEKEGLFMMNSLFRKREHKKWIWLNPHGATKYEIDFIMSTKRQIFNDDSVINAVKTGSDHSMVRGTLNIKIKFEMSAG